MMMQETRETQDVILERVTNAETSAKFVKQLTCLAVSTIAFLRNVFDGKDFQMKNLYEVNVWIIKSGKEVSEGANYMVKWLDGAFDALDKKFLKSLTFEIKDDENTLLEKYSFHYSFTGDEVECNFVATESSTSFTKSQAEVRQVMRNLLAMTVGVETLPKRYKIAMQLDYQEGTPLDYEPPGFHCFESENEFPQGIQTMKWRLGRVSTPFHTLEVSCKQSLKIPKISEGTSTSKNGKTDGSHVTDSVEVYREVLKLCSKAKSVSVRKLMKELKMNAESAVLFMRRLSRDGALKEHSSQSFNAECPDICYEVNQQHLIKSIYSKYIRPGTGPKSTE